MVRFLWPTQYSVLDKCASICVKVLLAHGAKVNGRFTELRTTSLMTTSFHGHSDVVRELLSHGARVQAVDKQGSTALSYAFGGEYITAYNIIE